MSRRSLGLLIWVTAAVVMGSAVAATRTEVVPIADAQVVHVAYAEPAPLLSNERSDRILTGSTPDPFFRDGVMAEIREAETMADASGPMAMEAIDPLRVAGILGGPPWHAVLYGGPLVSRAVVVARGDSIAHMLVLDVGPDSVRIQDDTGVRILMLESR